MVLPTDPIRLRRFVLIRDRDVSGMSGTGVVGEGVVFSDGSACMRWRTETPSIANYDSVDDLIKIHNHVGSNNEGGTEIHWIDDDVSFEIVQTDDLSMHDIVGFQPSIGNL